jgi:hypothetical protein
VTNDNLAHLPDFYGHRRTELERAAIWSDGTPIPWMTYPAISYLNQIDFSQKQVFEYGAGNSTLFWARRARRVISVEHDPAWYENVRSQNTPNAEISLASGYAYVEAIKKDAPHDVIVVDGRWRFDCTMNCLGYLAPGGMVILDNSERHPPLTAFLREHDLIQVDMIGHGPQNKYIWCTSIFLTRTFAFPSAKAIQPHHGPGMEDSIEVRPERAASNQPGSFA